MSDKKTGILLLSHGSRLDDGEEVIKAYKEMYLEEFPDAIVEYGFMEIRKPGIQETIKTLTEQGDLEKIIVVPVFVAHGLHTKRDIPGLLGIESDFDEEEVSGHHHHHHDHDDHDDHEHHHGHHHHHHHDHDEEPVEFDGEIILTDPLGIDRRMYEIIKDRVSEYL
ncbi:sirohydrochlorin cobaltochelatase [Methanobrevibacter sp. YE315]|uniref:sirohydrochlorin nickelochelatase n=1 Tax=Methanobrevibacter sp. YE315 TaxID=1609968 RepID=UPI000764EADF|nr:sirohydrochlorin nickelochelatase [Methanobrevibacter sp. YE315]AMD16595.1 sirohydrochlorin cobaltochelatase [Methanobrevibacter sp. YE315]